MNLSFWEFKKYIIYGGRWGPAPLDRDVPQLTMKCLGSYALKHGKIHLQEDDTI